MGAVLRKPVTEVLIYLAYQKDLDTADYTEAEAAKLSNQNK